PAQRDRGLRDRGPAGRRQAILALARARRPHRRWPDLRGLDRRLRRHQPPAGACVLRRGGRRHPLRARRGLERDAPLRPSRAGPDNAERRFPGRRDHRSDRDSRRSLIGSPHPSSHDLSGFPRLVRISSAMKLLTAILILALALPGTALAKKHPSQGQFSIPLDNSGVAQYLEVIPTAGGGRPSGGLHSQRTPSPTQSTTQSAGTVTPSAPITPSAVAPSTQRVLATHGARGRQAARVANETAPSGI